MWVHEDNLTDLRFEDGTVLTTTEDHPFWSVDDQVFERTDELAAGERVLSADGVPVAVEGIEVGGRNDLAYNLTVDGLHTYHVGVDEILVHNDGESPVGTIFRDGSYSFQIYSNDHGPAHGHLRGPGIPGGGIQLGQNGKPLDPNVTLTSAERDVVDRNLSTIRKSIGKYMRWYRQNGPC